MTSNSDSFSFMQSTTQELGSNPTKAKQSPVWQYCRPGKKDNEDPNLMYCTFCDSNSSEKSYSSNISTNMCSHLQTHNITVEKSTGKIQADTIQQLNQLYLQAKTIGKTDIIDTQVLQLVLNKAVIDEALLTLIVVQNLPFSLVE
jgi:hypothetical protein